MKIVPIDNDKKDKNGKNGKNYDYVIIKPLPLQLPSPWMIDPLPEASR